MTEKEAVSISQQLHSGNQIPSVNISVNLKTGEISHERSNSDVSKSFRSLKKSSSLSTMSGREETLFAKQAEYQAKLNLKVLEKQAKEVSELRQAPEINPRSRKLAAKIKDKQSVEIKVQKKIEVIEKTNRASGSLRISTESLLDSLKARPHSFGTAETEKKPPVEAKNESIDKSNLSVIDRTHIWLEKKKSKIEEKKSKNKNKELDQCTFQPQLYERILPDASSMSMLSDSKISQTSFTSFYSRKKDYEKKHTSSMSGIAPYKAEEEEVSGLARFLAKGPYDDEVMTDSLQATMPNMKYAPITPVNKQFRFKTGFNESSFKKNAKPMLAYRLD